jgi:SpoVK/Ycf46/Vps4 family AAA+-type ATPase
MEELERRIELGSGGAEDFLSIFNLMESAALDAKDLQSIQTMQRKCDQYAKKLTLLSRPLVQQQPLVKTKTEVLEQQQQHEQQEPEQEKLDRTKFSYDALIGFDSIKSAFRTHIELRKKAPHLFTAGSSLKTVTSTLLHGTPGTGKTFLAKCVAGEFDLNFIEFKLSSVLNMFVGETEKNMVAIFNKAKNNAPCLLFLDEIDSVLSSREKGEADHVRKAKTIFLTEFDKIRGVEGVHIVGATNLPWELDSAARRRFDQSFHIPLPDYETRESIILRFYSGTDIDTVLDANQLHEMVEKMEGRSIDGLYKILNAASFARVQMLEETDRFVFDGQAKSWRGVEMCSTCLFNTIDKGDKCEDCGAVYVGFEEMGGWSASPPLRLPELTLDLVLRVASGVPYDCTAEEEQKHVQYLSAQ